MTHKVVTGADGRMKTEAHSDTAAQAKLAQTRKELRDMLAGNTQFHTDNLGQGPKLPEPEVREVFESSDYLLCGAQDRALAAIADEMRRQIDAMCGVPHA